MKNYKKAFKRLVNDYINYRYDQDIIWTPICKNCRYKKEDDYNLKICGSGKYCKKALKEYYLKKEI